VHLGHGVQVVTRGRYAPWIESLLAGRRKARLSRAALETAAVIAYKQPITRLDIERIRGVDVGAVLSTLLERNLILIKGRDAGPGRPLLYGTTQGFLDYFGLSRLTDLPRLDEIAALAKAQAQSVWADDEIARFEKHGVDAAEVPFPEEPSEDDAGGAGLEESEAREEDRAEFEEVVTAFTGETAGAGALEGEAGLEDEDSAEAND
jgi:segregation and condensation protein B